MARLAGTLPHGAAPRLERLRGFGGRFGTALMCGCSRVTLADGTPAILVVATEPAGPRMSLEERARRLLTGCDEPIALYTVEGAPLYATQSAQTLIGRADSLTELGVSALAATALTAGHATGDHGAGIRLWRRSRLGHGASTILLKKQKSAEAGAEARCHLRATSGRPPNRPSIQARRLRILPRRRRLAASRHLPRIAGSRCALVWQMDVDLRFTVDSEEFRALIGTEHGRGPWPAVERDRCRARPRSRRPGRARARLARNLERHHGRVSGGRHRCAAVGRIVRTAGVRSRPQLPRLSRLRRLPRRRAHERADARPRRPAAARRAAGVPAGAAGAAGGAAVGKRAAVPLNHPGGEAADADPCRAGRVQRARQPPDRPLARARQAGPPSRMPPSRSRRRRHPTRPERPAARHRTHPTAPRRAPWRPTSARSSTGCRSASWSTGSTG